MRLQSLHIQNFRSFKDQVISFDTYTCVAGPNGSGKSAILSALNVLFRDQSAPTDVTYLGREDFHVKDITDPIRITATFDNLSASAKDDLKAYIRQDRLIISAVAEWDPSSNRAEVKQVGSRLVMRAFAPFFEAFEAGAKAGDLKDIFRSLKGTYADLDDVSTKDAMRDALRDYEEKHPEKTEPVESGDQFYGWSRGVNRLEKHLQWVFVPAVKDSSDEQNETKDTALGRLLQRTIRAKVDFTKSIESLKIELAARYQDLLTNEQAVLKEVASSLEKRLREWSHPGARVDLIWNYDEQKSVSIASPLARAKVGEGNFLGDLARLGHGLQRSFLVAILQELASINQEGQPTLLLGIEEPELYQHPPQARHLASLLESLSTSSTQVILTTHSPYFVSARGFENIRLARKSSATGQSSVSQLTRVQLSKSLAEALKEPPRTPSATMAAVGQVMQPSQSELYFSKLPVLVEGTEDIGFVSTYLKLSGRWTEFRKLGCHFVVCGGKNPMSRPLAIGLGLAIPCFVIADADSDRCDNKAEKQSNERDNGCLLRLCGHDLQPLPTETYWLLNMVLWKTRILEEVRSEIGPAIWDKAEHEVRVREGFESGVNRKNPFLIAGTLEHLWAQGTKSATLEKLCGAIISFGHTLEAQ